MVGLGWVVCRWWWKETTHKNGVVASFFAIFVAIFSLLLAAAEEHLGVSWLPRPRRVGGCWGGLGGAGAKKMGPWLFGGGFSALYGRLWAKSHARGSRHQKTTIVEDTTIKSGYNDITTSAVLCPIEQFFVWWP